MKKYIKATFDKVVNMATANSETSDVVLYDNNMQNTSKEISFADCQTSDELIVKLSQIADTMDQTLAYTLKAQLQVIKYISSPEMIGSIFDLLFKNIKKSMEYADQDNLGFIKERSAHILNNFILFMRAKLEWEITENRKQIENQLVTAANEVADNILSITGYACNMTFEPEVAKKIGKVLFDPNKENSGWYKNFKKLFFTNAQLKEKQRDFIKSLDLLAKKLEHMSNVLGKNDIISGIFENYRDQLIESHSLEWEIYEQKAKHCRKKSWYMSLLVIIISLLCGVAIIYVFFKSVPVSETLAHSGIDWLSNVSKWIGIGALCTSIIVALSYRIGGIRYKKKAQRMRTIKARYYDNIIRMYREHSH